MITIKEYLEAKSYLEFAILNGMNRDEMYYTKKMLQFCDQVVKGMEIRSSGIHLFTYQGDHDKTELVDTVYISSGLNLGNNYTDEHALQAILDHEDAEIIVEAIGDTRGYFFQIEAPCNFNTYCVLRFETDQYNYLYEKIQSIE